MGQFLRGSITAGWHPKLSNDHKVSLEVSPPIRALVFPSIKVNAALIILKFYVLINSILFLELEMVQ